MAYKHLGPGNLCASHFQYSRISSDRRINVTVLN